jgi:hypothetical protein
VDARDLRGRLRGRGQILAGLGLVPFRIHGAHSLDTVLDCRIGTWFPATHTDGYDTGDEAKCIDRRANVPTAPDDATGIGYWRRSDDHGWILYILDLDCQASS